jgi:exodeoxyribonuclease VIII
MNDVMIDLETLGTHAGCVVLSIGAVAFSKDDDELGSEFYIEISRESCLAANLVVDDDTVTWWSNQSPEARDILSRTGADGKATPLPHALGSFTQWLSQFDLGKVSVWGNGAAFDQPILEAAYLATGVEAPWKFYNARCYRTLKGLYRDVLLPDRVGVYHNALDDAKTQALHAIQLLRTHYAHLRPS